MGLLEDSSNLWHRILVFLHLVKKTDTRAIPKKSETADVELNNELQGPSPQEFDELTKPMTAPEVPLRDVLPDFVKENLDTILTDGCWSLLLIPEEEFSRWFAVFSEGTKELGRTPIAQHEMFMHRLNACASGAVTVDETHRYRIEDFRSFNEFGDRYTIQFFEEGVFSCDEAILRRRDNIRLVNRLCPADTVTAKNEDDLARVIRKNQISKKYLDHLTKDGLLSESKRASIQDTAKDLLDTMRSIKIPRKMAAIALADCLAVEYIEVGSVNFDKAVTHIVDMEWKQQHQVFPYMIDEGKLKVAMADPSDSLTVKALEGISKCPAKVYCAAARDIDNMIKKAHKDD